MIKKRFLFGLALLMMGQLLNAQTKIYVYKSNGSATEFNTADIDSISFNPTSSSAVDYSKIKINEVSGVGGDTDKFYELINIGTKAVSLEGCKIFYNANGNPCAAFPPNGNQGLTWTGKETHVIQPDGLLLLLGRITVDNPNGDFTTGLTAGRILIITLRDPAGNIIDQCIRAQDCGLYNIGNKSFSRIPDGTGPFYFTDPTPEIMNGMNATGLLEVPTTPHTVITTADYTKLRLNEISGVGDDNQRFYELINLGDEDIDLDGCKIYYNNDPFNAAYTAPLTWAGCSDQVIKAGELLCLTGRGAACSFTTGLTPQRVIKITFSDPDGNLIDEFMRAKDSEDYNITTKSFSRIPDGTGLFYFADPTPEIMNGMNATGLLEVPDQVD